MLESMEQVFLTRQPEQVHLRRMQESDLAQVYQLEVAGQPAPWPSWYFRRQLRDGASCWVLESGRTLTGFGIISFTGDQAHIMNLGVAPAYRRRGLGRRLMLHLLGVAREQHCRHVWLEVRRTNRPAILLYRELGFRMKEILKGYYATHDGTQSGLLMSRPVQMQSAEY